MPTGRAHGDLEMPRCSHPFCVSTNGGAAGIPWVICGAARRGATPTPLHLWLRGPRSSGPAAPSAPEGSPPPPPPALLHPQFQKVGAPRHRCIPGYRVSGVPSPAAPRLQGPGQRPRRLFVYLPGR